MTKLDRETAIDQLIEDDLDTGSDYLAYLGDILRDGFKGYCNFTDEELVEEFRARGEEIMIAEGGEA